MICMRHSRLPFVLSLVAFLAGCPNMFLPPAITPNTTQEVTNNTGEIEQRNDLAAEVTFFPPYNVGGKFDLLWAIQNLTSNKIEINNNNFEYKIMRVGENGDEEFTKADMSKVDFDITLLEHGLIETLHKNDGLKVSVSNVEAIVDGKFYYVPAPLKIGYNSDVQQPILDKAGLYYISASVGYKVGDKTYNVELKSEKVPVEQE